MLDTGTGPVASVLAITVGFAGAIAVTELAARTRWFHRTDLSSYRTWNGRTDDHAKKERKEGVNGFVLFFPALFVIMMVTLALVDVLDSL